MSSSCCLVFSCLVVLLTQGSGHSKVFAFFICWFCRVCFTPRHLHRTSKMKRIYLTGGVAAKYFFYFTEGPRCLLSVVLLLVVLLSSLTRRVATAWFCVFFIC